MILPYFVFALDLANIILMNGVFHTQVLTLEGSVILIGFIGSSAAFFSFLWKPIAGRLSDEYGSVFVLFGCLFGGLVGNWICFSSETLCALLTGRLITSLASPSSVLVRAIISDMDKKNQIRNLNRLGVITAITSIVSVIIIGHAIESSNRVYIIYTLMIIINIINLVLVLLLPTPELIRDGWNIREVRPIPAGILTELNKLKDFAMSEKYWEVFLIRALTMLSFSTIDSNCIIIYASLGIVNKQVSYLFTCICAFSILSNIVLLKVNKKYYEKDLGYDRILHGCLLLILTYIIQGVTSTVWIFILTLLIMTSPKVQVDNTTMELLMNKIDQNEKSVVLGCFDSINSLTDLLSPLLSSFALEYTGKLGVYLISVFLLSISCKVINKTQASDVDQTKNK